VAWTRQQLEESNVTM